MIRIFPWLGAVALAALGAACGDDAFLDPPPVSAGGSAGAAGSGGAAGASGSAGGSAVASGGGAAGAGGSVSSNAGGAAGAGGSGAGSVAGSGGSTAGRGGSGLSGDAPDAGDSEVGLEVPASVDAGACGTDAITTVPSSREWRTTNDVASDVLAPAACQACDNTDDFIVTFTAPATDVYRFTATSDGDSELAVYPGRCPAVPADVSCGDDVNVGIGNYDDRVEVPIARGETVTVVVSESCEEDGGAGTLTVQLAP